jgi:hypothetical protein
MLQEQSRALGPEPIILVVRADYFALGIRDEKEMFYRVPKFVDEFNKATNSLYQSEIIKFPSATLA